MHILGIETSCDETAAAIVDNGRNILSNVVVSSLKEHAKYGGVIPEIASRRQLECVNAVVDKALSDAGLKLSDIHAIAVTSHPGLIGSLLVGLSFARGLSFSTNKPLVEIDHIKAHLYANFVHPVQNNATFKQPSLPAVGLVVSGGHTSLFYVKNFSNIKLLGQTVDDAAGEAFDKVAKILDLGYPGGPVIDRLAKNYQGNGLKFNSAELPDSYNFSFSGVKTAVLYHTRKHAQEKSFDKRAVVHAFQHSVVSILVKKSIEACLKMKTKTLLIGGGVAANSYLRERLQNEAKTHKIKTYFPEFALCLDNAAMIAGLGYHALKKKEKK